MKTNKQNKTTSTEIEATATESVNEVEQLSANDTTYGQESAEVHQLDVTTESVNEVESDIASETSDETESDIASETSDETESDIELEVQKLSAPELKAQYAVEKEAARLAHDVLVAADPTISKFTYQPFSEYKVAYQAQWDLTHPNEKDAIDTTVITSTITDASSDAAISNVGSNLLQSMVIASKSQRAQAIFAAELQEKGAAGLVRKDIIARFIAEVGLTKPGANTYYQNIREKHNLVQRKAEVPLLIKEA